MDTELLTTVMKVVLYGTGSVLLFYVLVGIAHSILIWWMGYGDD